MGLLWRDLRYAARLLRRQPGWSTAVILTLALGIGANSAAFSLTDAALLRSLPFPDPGRLVWISANGAQPGLVGATAVSDNQLQQWQPALAQLFSAVGAVSAGGAGNVWRIDAVAATPFARVVSGNFFATLGVRPELGRLIAAADATAAKGGVVVISDQFWRRTFGADPHVIGRRLEERLSTFGEYTIVGVLPPQFRLDQPTDIWVPDVPGPVVANSRNRYLVGRLRPGATLAAARALVTQLEGRYPAPGRATVRWPATMAWIPQVTPLQQVFGQKLRLSLLLLQLATACLFLLACANVANLYLGRAWYRRQELAVRAALGGSRARLLRQLLTEAALLATLAALAGLGLAAAATRLLSAWGAALLPAPLLRDFLGMRTAALTPAVLLFTGLATAGAVLLFGLLPAWRAAGFSLRAAAQTGAHANRASRGLVAVEAALATLLVASAGLLIHSFSNLDQVDPGFQSAGRISVALELPLSLNCSPRPACVNAQRQNDTAYLHAALDRLRALPAVAAVAGAGDVPLGEDTDSSTVAVPAAPLAMTAVFPTEVTPGYFPLMGLRLSAGRDFDAGDAYGQPKAVVVNQSFARQYFPGRNPVGLRLHLPRCQGLGNPDPQGCTVIGIVADMRDESLALPPQPEVFMAYDQDPGIGLQLMLESRDTGRTLPALDAMLRGLPPVNGSQPYVFPARTLDSAVALSVATPRFRAWLAGLLALLALLIAALGIFGVQSYAVARRVREVGVRMALGASSGNIFRGVVAQALLWTAAGLGAGLLAALAVARLLAGMLFGVGGLDPLSLLATPVVLLTAAAVAAALPAWRAARTDPARALRAEP